MGPASTLGATRLFSLILISGDLASAAPCSGSSLILKPLRVSKVKLLSQELTALREAGAQAAESLQSAQAANVELEGRLQHSAWELRDLAAVKDVRCVCPSVRVCLSWLTTVGRPPTHIWFLQDKRPGRCPAVCAAHPAEGRGGLQEEVSVPGCQSRHSPGTLVRNPVSLMHFSSIPRIS